MVPKTCVLTFEGLVDGEVESHVRRYAQDGGEQPAVEAATPDPALLPQDGAEGMADVPEGASSHATTINASVVLDN